MIKLIEAKHHAVNVIMDLQIFIMVRLMKNAKL